MGLVCSHRGLSKHGSVEHESFKDLQSSSQSVGRRRRIAHIVSYIDIYIYIKGALS